MRKDDPELSSGFGRFWPTGACGCCAYFEREKPVEDGYQEEGICRRRAPVAIASKIVDRSGESAERIYGHIAAWPRVFGETDWCGDYVVKRDLGGRFETSLGDLAAKHGFRLVPEIKGEEAA